MPPEVKAFKKLKKKSHIEYEYKIIESFQKNY